jgi:hypothetical protein
VGSKPETRFYMAVHRLLPANLHKEKMANPYRGGTADVWYSGTLDDLWVEYKYLVKVPKKASIQVLKDLSALQQHWLKERHKEGRNVVVILGTPLGAWIFERLEWETRLITADELQTSGHTKHSVADYIRRRTMIACE